MKNLITLALAFLFVLSPLSAQKKQLTPEDAAFLNRDIFPVSMANLAWMGNSDSYAFREKDALVRGRVNAESRDTLLKSAALSEALVEAGGEELKRLPSVEWISETVFIFHHKNTIWSYDLSRNQAKKLITYPDQAQNADLHKGSMRLAYTIENNLFITGLNQQQWEVSHDSNGGIVNGQEVHRREFGIDKGTFWSPDASRLAFYRKDERMVSEYPLVDVSGRIAKVSPTRYPMAGEVSEEVQIGVFHLETGKTLFLETGAPKDQYLTAVSWGPEGQYLYVALLNRDQNHLKLNRYDATTGKYVNTILEEKHPKYVEPEHPLYFVPGKPEQFVWFSERSGFPHLYLYDTEGKMIRQLTSGSWGVTDFLGFDPEGRRSFFMATAESPLEKHLYAVDIKRGIPQKITYAPGTHSVVMREDKAYLFDIYSNTEVAREYLLLDGKGSLVEMLRENKDPLEDYALGETSIFTLQAQDGTELYSRMILPPGFDPAQQYPVIIYVYGGPHAQLITNSWLGGAGLFLNYLAQQGYIVFTLDNRGSAERGLAFEQAIFRECGKAEVEDQMQGVAYLKSLPYVDTTRIGVHGWSYGGFMTISMMLKNPGVFKAGVAGGPVIDWQYYEVMYGERYMDTPGDNPEGYKASNLMEYADKLEGELLVIHGTMDPVVVWQHSLRFIQWCIENGKMVDYFGYPGHEHNVRGKDRAHLHRVIDRYFKEKL